MPALPLFDRADVIARKPVHAPLCVSFGCTKHGFVKDLGGKADLEIGVLSNLVADLEQPVLIENVGRGLDEEAGVETSGRHGKFSLNATSERTACALTNDKVATNGALTTHVNSELR